MTPFIEVEHLTKVFTRSANEVRALDDVEMEIHQGEFVALMGPSGSGKTTLLNILAGIDSPTSGRAVVDGVEVPSLTESQRTAWRTRAVGYIFQFYNLMPVLTAWENVELPLLLTPLSRKERQDHVHAALEAVDLLDRRDHFPRQLSGGQEEAYHQRPDRAPRDRGEEPGLGPQHIPQHKDKRFRHERAPCGRPIPAALSPGAGRGRRKRPPPRRG